MAVGVAGTRRLFTREEYHRMAEVGILKPTDRVELIRGEIIEMSPPGRRHRAFVDNLNQLLTLRIAGRAIVSVQNPVVLAADTEPESDLKIIRRRRVSYRAYLQALRETEPYRIECTVPDGVDRVVVRLDYICNQPTINSEGVDNFGNAYLGLINWNTCLVYPEGPTIDELHISARLLLPAKWRFGTALQVAKETDAAIKKAGKPSEIHIYPGVDHGFFNDERPDAYDRGAAEDAWKRTTEFFTKHLK